MPRNGDGSSDNGPIEGQNIVHGAGGDTTLKHAQNVAPMPEAEKGEAIPGMNASGGGSSVIGTTGQGAHANDSNKAPVVDQATKQ